MRPSWRHILLPPVLAGALAAAPTSPSDADPADLERRIDALEAQVRQLRAEQQAIAQRKEIESAKGAVQADAKRQSQLLDIESFTAGYNADRGFILQSQDGRFVLHPSMVTQFRNVTNYRQDATAAGRHDTENGFELRRVKLVADGNAFSADVTYQTILSVDRKTGTVSLEDAWVRYRLPDTHLYIRAGQIRDPLDHEQISFAAFSLTADRSLVDDLFAAVDGLTEGVSLGFDNNGPFRSEAAYTNGLRGSNTSFQDFPSRSANWGVAGRVEYKLAGEWKDYAHFTALGAKRELLVIGAGADYTEAGRTGQLVHAVDFAYESPGGFSAYAAYLGRYVRHDGAPPGTNGSTTAVGPAPDTYDATLRAQAAYLFNGRWEPFVRYEYIHFDGAELPKGSVHSVVHEFTTGVNYYFHGHHAKFTADATYLPNGSPVSDDGSSVLSSHGGSEVFLRAQFQLIL
jgi:hypothetical protein